MTDDSDDRSAAPSPGPLSGLSSGAGHASAIPPIGGGTVDFLASASALEAAPTADVLWSGTVAAFAAAGLPHVIYITTDPARSRIDLRTTLPALYEDADPASDPFLDYCCTAYGATPTGAAFLPDYGYLPEHAQRFIRAAEELGFRSGLGIPTRLEGFARFGGFNLGSPLDAAAFEARIAPREAELRAFCLLLHRRFEEIGAAEAPALAALSPRESEILRLICDGATRKECARLLGLSPNTVADYTKSAYRKLGVRNRAEAGRRLRGDAGSAR